MTDIRSRRAETIGRIGLAVAIAGALLAFTIKVPDAYGIPKLLAVAAGALAAWWGVLAGSVPGERVGGTPPDRAVLLCIAVVTLATAFSEDPPRSVSGGYVYFLYGILPVSLFASLHFAASRLSRPETILWTLRAALGAAVLCGAYAGLQAAGLEPLLPVASAGTIKGRVISTLGGPVYLGSALVAFAPLALHFALKDDPADRALGLLATLAVWTGMFFSVSRGAMAGGMAACAFAWIASRRDLSRRFRSSGALVVTVAAGAALAALLAFGTSRSRTASDAGRVEVWKTALRTAVAHPVLGVGPDAFEIGLRRHRTERLVALVGPGGGQADAHNEFLQIAATMGVVGLLAYGFLLWSLAAALVSALSQDGPERALTAALGGALVGVFIQAKVNPVSFSAIVSLSVFSGWISARSRPIGPEVPVRPAAGVFLGLAFASLIFSAVLFHTDHLRQIAETARARGDMDTAIVSYRSAIRRNPCYCEYGSAYGSLLAMLVFKAPEPVRPPLAKELFVLARKLKKRHPGDVRGSHMLGLACLVGGKLAGEDCLQAAEKELERARRLDPYSPAVLRDSAGIARLAGDSAAAAGFEKRRDAILALRVLK
ncbi:MAG: O-antigen ligase family protein [Elusimicrobiota bacterium]